MVYHILLKLLHPEILWKHLKGRSTYESWGQARKKKDTWGRDITYQALSHSEVISLEMLSTLAQTNKHTHIYTHTYGLRHLKSEINQIAKSSKVLVYGLLKTSRRGKLICKFIWMEYSLICVFAAYICSLFLKYCWEPWSNRYLFEDNKKKTSKVI